MKNQIFVGIILILITGIFAKNKIFDDKVELKYSLSERISADFESDSLDIGIQQLLIKNSGDLLARTIIIKINTPIQDYRIKKFKYTDTVSSKNTKVNLEILYPELVPEGQIVVLLKSKGKSISNTDVEIYHDKGEAKEAFSNSDSYSGIILWLFVLFYVYLIINQLVKLAPTFFEYDLNYNQIGFLRKKKKWYLKESQWGELRNKAIINYVNKGDYYLSIEKQNCFIILNSIEKDFLSEEENRIMYSEAEEKLQKILIENIYKSYYSTKLYEEFVTLKKPLRVTNEKWNTFKEIVSIAYCIHNTKRLLKHSNVYSIKEFLSSSKPDFVNDSDWNDMLAITESSYLFLTIKTQLINLNFNDKINMKEYEFLSDNSKKILVEVLESLSEGLRKEKYYKLLVDIYYDVLTWETLQEKPELILDKDWSRIKYIFENIVSKRNNLADNEIEVAKQKDIYSNLVIKVRRQLEIINNLLKEPNSINTVEEYDIPFAEGNWKNLKKIGEIMKLK